MSAPLDTLPEQIAAFPRAEWEALVATRRDLHRHPELGFEEERTAGVVADRLRALNLSPRTGVGKTGVIADPPSEGPAPAGLPSDGGRILLRADMDGLPLSEATGAEYASQEPGKMHACGHDGHVAIALSVAGRLAKTPRAKRFRFLFQPAEEGAGGAEACVRDGALEGVTGALGLHLWNQLPVTLGNIVSGAFFTGLALYITFPTKRVSPDLAPVAIPQTVAEIKLDHSVEAQVL